MIKRDNIHFTFNEIDGYNKVFNFVISPREPGKTTAALLDKVYKSFMKGKPYVLLRRRIADVTNDYIDSCLLVINKFLDKKDQLAFVYRGTDVSKGMARIYCGDKLFMSVIGLSSPVSRIKSLMIPNIGGIIFDEFICNQRLGEKYLKQEAFKFKELYSTYQRESEGKLKVYFLGNPYSRYNPYFTWKKVPLEELKLGTVVSKDDYAVQTYEMKPELKEYILKHNPLYEFDDEYKKYGFFGQSVNDQNIILVKSQPPKFKLIRLFTVENSTIGVYANRCSGIDEIDYWCKLETNIGLKRTVWCLDVDDLAQNRRVMSFADKNKNNNLADSMRRNRIGFKDVTAYQLFITVYNFL